MDGMKTIVADFIEDCILSEKLWKASVKEEKAERAKIEALVDEEEE